MIALLFLLLQAAQPAPDRFAYMALESVLNAWTARQACRVQAPDSLIAPNRLGQTHLRMYTCGTSRTPVALYRTADGRVWDAGVFQPELHQPSLADYEPFIITAERITLALHLGDLQYARAVMALAELDIKYGVGEPLERIKTLLGDLKGYTQTVSVTGIRYEAGLFTAQFTGRNAKGRLAFDVSMRASGNLFLNGQINLWQEQLVTTLKPDASRAAPSRTFSPFIRTQTEGALLTLQFPDFKPYDAILRFEKGRTVSSPVIAGSDRNTRSEAMLRAFWTGLHLPDSLQYSGVVPPGRIRVIAASRHDRSDAQFTLPEWTQWMNSRFGDIHPVYYGPMKPIEEKAGVYSAVGSWSVMDPLLRMEHLFKVEQEFRLDGERIQLLSATVTATFCVRLDNVERLHASGSDGPASDLPVFKIDLKNPSKQQ